MPVNKETLHRELLKTAWGMQKTLHEVVTPVCQRHGVTLQQLHVLVELSNMPGAQAGQLSDRAGILRTNFAPVCHRLEERGLVEKQRSDFDKRSFNLHVTDEGRALLRSIDEEARNACAAALEGQSAQDLEAVEAGLAALNAFVRNLGR